MFGLDRKCHGCGGHYSWLKRTCPHCLTPAGQRSPKPVSEGGPAQLVKVYRGNHAMRDFKRDAERLARAGWKVATQAASGRNAMKIGNQPPTMVSVTYVR